MCSCHRTEQIRVRGLVLQAGRTPCHMEVSHIVGKTQYLSKLTEVRRLPRTVSQRSFNGRISGSLLHTIAKALAARAFGAPTPEADVRCYIHHQMPMRRTRPLVN